MDKKDCTSPWSEVNSFVSPLKPNSGLGFYTGITSPLTDLGTVTLTSAGEPLMFGRSGLFGTPGSGIRGDLNAQSPQYITLAQDTKSEPWKSGLFGTDMLWTGERGAILPTASETIRVIADTPAYIRPSTTPVTFVGTTPAAPVSPSPAPNRDASQLRRIEDRLEAIEARLEATQAESHRLLIENQALKIENRELRVSNDGLVRKLRHKKQSFEASELRDMTEYSEFEVPPDDSPSWTN